MTRPPTPSPARPVVRRVYAASARSGLRSGGGGVPPKSGVQTDDKGVDGEVGLASWAAAMVADSTPMALMPGREEELAMLLDEVGGCLELAYAESTNRTDKSHMKAWKEVCAELGTSPWRTDMAANMGVDPVGYRRELLLPAIAYLKMKADAPAL